MSEDAPTTYRVGTELRRDVAVPVVVALMLAVGLILLPHLPPRVVTHWNAAGQPNGWSAPLAAVLLPPALALGIWLLLLLLPAIDPRRANYATFLGFYRGLRLAVVLVAAAAQAATLWAAAGHGTGGLPLTQLVVAALFVFVGNSLGRVRPNYFVGIRTPWTLANEEVWRRTHRFAAPLFVAGGLVAALGIVLPAAWRVVALIVGVAGAAVVSVVYSYFAFRRIAG